MTTIGNKIKYYRKALQLTQEEFGQMLGVQKNAVSKWECGRVDDIPTSKIKMMAEIFNIPLSSFIDDEAPAYSFFDNIFPIQTKKNPPAGRDCLR